MRGARNQRDPVDPRTDDETELWRAVLRITFEDAQGLFTDSGALTEHYKNTQTAHSRAFLLYDKEDFPEVCLMAGYDPGYVREQAVRIIVDKAT